jgi:bacillithiol biosynthesis cysteine-adding enzyme BshC
MPESTLSYKDTGYFSSLICDYLAEKPELQHFYELFPREENILRQLQKKKDSFSAENRKILTNRLKAQYEGIKTSEATDQNIEALLSKDTFTITTGHQLNLNTGPLYFLYKIFSVINLSEKLYKKYPDYRFVPVYWMATEDHDLEEINYFNLFGKKIRWDKESGGAVGELSTGGMEQVRKTLKAALGSGKNAERIIELFSKAYLDHKTLAEATRYLANALFSEYGLVIIDGNDAELKKAFIPYAEKELNENLSYKKVTETTSRLIELGYSEQVHPREINLFYLKDGLRERIIEREGVFYVNETSMSFTKAELIHELNAQPERFSPNALLRPLFQEVILPNLCYVGGGGELAYWLQLKDYFDAVSIPFPMLLLRNSVLLLPERLSEKLIKMDVPVKELFLPKHELEAWFTRKISGIPIDFSEQRKYLKDQFASLYKTAEQTDASFYGAVAAQEKKQLNGLDKLEKRLLKAQKRKLSDALSRLTAVQEALFPHGNLQERNLNYSEMYLEHGDRLFEVLKEQLDPLSGEFTILKV